jgi:hypothetical protein
MPISDKACTKSGVDLVGANGIMPALHTLWRRIGLSYVHSEYSVPTII